MLGYRMEMEDERREGMEGKKNKGYTPQPLLLATPILNPLEFRSNYIATSNNLKLVHWPLMCGLLHLVQEGRD